MEESVGQPPHPPCRWHDRQESALPKAVKEHIHGPDWAATLTLAAAQAGEADDMDAAPSHATMSADAGAPSPSAPSPTEKVLPPQLGPAEISPGSGQARAKNPG